MARYIDADKLILSMRRCAEDEHSKRASTTWADAFEDFIDEIEDLLMDDKDEVAPVVHAHWVRTEYDGYADGYPVSTFECSNCGEEHYGEEDTLTDYCPHCGAKMDEDIPMEYFENGGI